MKTVKMPERYLIEDADGAPFPPEIQDTIWAHIDQAVMAERVRCARAMDDMTCGPWATESWWIAHHLAFEAIMSGEQP